MTERLNLTEFSQNMYEIPEKSWIICIRINCVCYIFSILYVPLINQLPSESCPHIRSLNFTGNLQNRELSADIGTLIQRGEVRCSWDHCKVTEFRFEPGWSIFPGGSVVRICLPMQKIQETWVQSLAQEDPLEKEMAMVVGKDCPLQ